MLGSVDRAGISISPISDAVAASSIMGAQAVSTILGGALGLAIFGVIWLSNQAFHTVALLSPSMLLASGMRLLHLLALAVLLLVSALSPVFGAILAAILIFISARLAGWSFRLSIFGTVFAWDILALRRAEPVKGAVLAFSSASMPIAPRTVGQLISSNGKLTFAYRSWLVGPLRKKEISGAEMLLTHGVFYSTLVDAKDGAKVVVLAFPPRYRDSEDALARFAGCMAIPSTLKGGLGATAFWLGGLGR